MWHTHSPSHNSVYLGSLCSDLLIPRKRLILHSVSLRTKFEFPQQMTTSEMIFCWKWACSECRDIRPCCKIAHPIVCTGSGCGSESATNSLRIAFSSDLTDTPGIYCTAVLLQTIFVHWWKVFALILARGTCIWPYAHTYVSFTCTGCPILILYTLKGWYDNNNYF